jgi:hypothetical protein
MWLLIAAGIARVEQAEAEIIAGIEMRPSAQIPEPERS